MSMVPVNIQVDDAFKNQATTELLRIINSSESKPDLIHSVTVFLKRWLNCDAIGIRLNDGDDFPYYETSGFPEKFVRAERSLCSYDSQGNLNRDLAGNAILDCMCGNVLCKRTDPAKPFFTAHGSFWTNSTTELLRTTTNEDRKARTRNRCNGEGYESVGLFPLRIGAATFGLLQVNDKRRDLFNSDLVSFLEQFADNLAIRLAHLRAEDAMRDSEERHRLIFENSGDGILFTDPNGPIYSANPEACRLLGRTEAEIIAAGSEALVDFHDPRIIAALEQRRTHGYFKGEINFLRKDGTPVPVEITTNIFLNSEGEERASIILRDITERKRAEDALWKSEEKFSKAFKASPESIAIASMEDARYVDVNDNFLKIFGFKREDVIGHTAIELNVWADLEDRKRYIEELTRHDRIRNFETRFRLHSGEIGSFLVSSECIMLEGKKCSLNFILDITERKRTEDNLQKIEQRLRQSEKMEAVGQLAGGIAHDFNNVLGGIIGYTDMSLEFAERGSMLEHDLLQVLKAAERAKHLVKQILTFSRQGNPLKTVAAIRPIVQEVLDLLRSSIPSSVVIESDLRHDVKPVLADATQLHQALLNLATNAVQAMSRKGRLTVRLTGERLDHVVYGRSGELSPGEYAVIEVRDTGCGMDPQTLAKAFDPFFTTKPVGEGTGMGLSVVLGIVQSHGGDIQLESILGEGTTVRIYLPVVEAPVTGAGDKGPHKRSSGNERILFVDDEPMLVEMVEKILTQLGYTVFGTSNSSDALQMMIEKGSEIDLLITDQTMPGLTGIELAHEVRKVRKDLPIIVCTGFSSEVNPDRADAAGISRLIMKPYGSYEISKAVREVIDAKKNTA